jgi:hypothetical protein
MVPTKIFASLSTVIQITSPELLFESVFLHRKIMSDATDARPSIVFRGNLLMNMDITEEMKL